MIQLRRRETLEGNVLDVYTRASETEHSEGMRWYANANQFVRAVAGEFDLSYPSVAVALAHLSPRVHWKRNKDMLLDLVTTGTTNGMSSPAKRARLALASDTPFDTFGRTARKTHAFAHNLLLQLEYVTVDMWAIKAALPHLEIKSLTVAQYDRIAMAYRVAAGQVGITPAQFQAIVWCAIRGKAE